MSKEAMKRITRDDTEHGVEYYRADEVDSLLAGQPERELNKSGVCEDIQQLCINGDLPWQFEDVIDWITKGEIPAQPPQRKPLNLDELKALWNSQAEHMNQWDELGIDEIVAFAQADHTSKENT